MSQEGRRNVVCAIWSAVGLLLIWRGLPYLGLRADPEIVGLTGNSTWIALGVALVVGVGKGFTAIHSAARRAATHIVRSGELAPVWNVFSRGMLALVAFFVVLGLVLRLGPYDAGIKAWVIGIVYPAVGVSLLVGGQFARTVEPLERDSA